MEKCGHLLDVLFGGLRASHGAWKSLRGIMMCRCLIQENNLDYGMLYVRRAFLLYCTSKYLTATLNIQRPIEVEVTHIYGVVQYSSLRVEAVFIYLFH
jgi:hypothetical protein